MQLLLSLAVIGWCGASPLPAAADSVPLPPQRTSKTPSAYVGSAMAVLATLEQAQVLPPDGTREANLIIKSVIQCQSAFMKSEDPALREFLAKAVVAKHGDRAPDVIARFRSSGWTSDVLQALGEAAEELSTDQQPALEGGLSQYNLSVGDFQRLMGLVREAQRSLAARGLDFRQVYAAHRKDMPGAARP